MGFFIAGSITFFFSLPLLMAGIILHKQNVNFNKNKRYGKAEVVGYDREEQSNFYQLLVKLPELNDGKLYNCHSGKSIDTFKYPKGTVVDVMYSPQKFMGINVMEVHLLEDLPTSKEKLSNYFKYISYLLLLSIIFIIIGLLKIIL